MMKNRFATALLLALVLCLLAGTTALAYDKLNAVVFSRGDITESYQPNIESVAVATDAVYVIERETLYRWTPGMEEPEKLPLQVFSRSGGGAQDVENPLIVSNMFASGKAVYALDREAGDVKRIVDENGALLSAPEALFKLDLSFMATQNEEYVDSGSLSSICVAGDELILLCANYSSPTPIELLARYSLSTGAPVKQDDAKGVISVTPYKDGKLLMLCENEQGSYNPETGEEYPAQIYEYDIATGARTLLADTLGTSGTGLCYDPATGNAYFASGSVLYALDGVAGTPRVSAYLPEQVWRNSGYGDGLLDGGIYVHADWDGIVVRGLDMPGIENGALVVYGEYGSDQHKAVINAHPEMSVTTSQQWLDSIEQLTNAMVSGDSSVDVIKLDSSITPVKRLIQKGYALCLSDYPEITAITDTMEPAFLEPFMKDGKLYAVPVAMNAQCIGYNPEVLETLGLTADNLPKTFPELLDFMLNYYYDYGEDHPEINLFDDLNIKNGVLRRYLDHYVANQMKQTGEISFETDEFRAFLKGLEEIDFTELDPYAVLGEKFWDDQSASNEFWSKTALFTMYFGINGPEAFSEVRNNTTLLPLTLTDGAEPLYSAGLTVLMINPRTTRMQESVTYIVEYLKSLDPASAVYSLFPGNNEALLNATFEQNKQAMAGALETIKKSLETAPDDAKASIQADIEYYETELSQFEKYRYRITDKEVATYRETFAPYAYPVLQTPLSDYSGTGVNAFQSLIQQYLDGALDQERLIKEMDNRIRMMTLEDL